MRPRRRRDKGAPPLAAVPDPVVEEEAEEAPLPIPALDVEAKPDERRSPAFQLALALEDHGFLTPVGLVVTDPNMPIERYLSIGRWLSALRDLTAIALGDLLAYGEAVYGERFAQLAAEIDRDEETLIDYMRTAIGVPASRRIEGLSYHHYRLVRKMQPEEQTSWLRYAAENGDNGDPVSIRKLRDLIREKRGDVPGGDQGSLDVDAPKRSYVVEVAIEAAEQLAKVGNPTGDGYVAVPLDAWARFRAALGYDD